MKIQSILLKIVLFVILSTNFIKAQEWERLVNLKGGWKFSIGDDVSWKNPNYNDNDWEIVKVPSSWENEGYHGYNGYAWYRKHFTIYSSLKSRSITLKLGRIDDVDEVYINGKLVGASGEFPPQYQSAYFAWREYPIAESYFNFDGDNVIAVRVYDSQLEGGIIEGDIGFYELMGVMKMDFNLSGSWKFSTGDELTWKEPNFDDNNWKNILVPGSWESRGYKNYDGFAWYRKSVKIPANLANKKLVLVLGKIDDIDEVYINGKLVGSTGSMYGTPISFNDASEYRQFRGYFIPDGMLNANSEIVISVRVYDGYNVGGIYEGPIGFIEQGKYIKYWKEQKAINKRKINFWESVFEWD